MPVKIFFVYAHEDEALLNKLKAHLKPLQRQNLIDLWHDRDITAGAVWEEEIKKHLNEAHIILLLISPDFMDSDYCYGIEMQQALERHKNGTATVMPVILRHVYWQGEPLGQLQALPTDAKPVISSNWHSSDEAFLDVVAGIRKVVQESFQKEPIVDEVIFDLTHNYKAAISTGFKDLDRIIGGGFQRSDLIIVGAPPATGKTSFALSIALNAAIKYTRSVGIFSLEMSKERLIHRLLSIDSGIDQRNIQSGWLESDEWERITYALGTISEANIWIDDTSRLTTNKLREKAEQFVNDCKVDLIIVDYIDLIQREGNQNGKQYPNKEQDEHSMSRYLKVIARELNVPILALTQKPSMSRFNFSQASKMGNNPIDAAADIVLFLYRDEMVNPESIYKNLIDVIITKNRNGPTGEVTLYFRPDTTQFQDLVELPQENDSSNL